MNKFIIVLILMCVGLTACNPIVIEKTSETLSRVIYAVGDSLSAGRIDLADKYIANAETLVPIPKKRIVIKSFISNGIPYLIVDDKFKGYAVSVVGSTQFQSLLKDKKLADQYRSENKTLSQNIKDTATQLANNEKSTNELVLVNQNLNKEIVVYHNSLEYKIKSFFTGFKWFSIIGILALVALCCFMPTLIPVVFSVLGTCAGLLMKIFNIFIEIITNIISSFSAKV